MTTKDKQTLAKLAIKNKNNSLGKKLYKLVTSASKALDINGIPLSVGDKVNHYKFGECEVLSIDTKNYSIAMVIVYSKKLKDKIYRDASEFEKI